MKFVKAFLLLGVFCLGMIGILWVIGMLNQQDAVEYGKKAMGVIGVLVLISMASLLIVGKPKSDNKTNSTHQGPQF